MNIIRLMTRNNLNWFIGMLTSVDYNVKDIYRNANKPEDITWNIVGLNVHTDNPGIISLY